MKELKELAMIKADIQNNQLVAVANSEAFTRFLSVYQQANDLMELVKQELKVRGIMELPTQLGTLGFTEVPRYSLIKGMHVKDTYLRQAVDKKKVDDYQTKYHKLPKGIKSSVTKKFTKVIEIGA